MRTDAWLNKDHQFPPGQQLFRSDRRFSVWAYTVSHSQLVFRSLTGPGLRRTDIVFKPVEALKVRTVYDGLTIRCARADEHDRILAGPALAGLAYRVLMLETADGLTDGLDYVVALAVGWREDDRQDKDPSTLAGGTRTSTGELAIISARCGHAGSCSQFAQVAHRAILPRPGTGPAGRNWALPRHPESG